MAMVLADVFGKSSSEWSVHGTDLSSRVLEAAREATYYLRSGEAWPGDFLQRFCLKGVGPQEGRIAICPELVDKVSFSQMNLITPWPDMSPYSVVFLRNVMIYFQNDVKAKILKQMVRVVKPGGYLVVSQTESVSSLLPPEFKLVMPSIMQRVLP
jgi:chemotaxis protein methyltransferase CheR